MYIDFSALFHQSSKDGSAGGRVKLPGDKSLWPEEWKGSYYKEYPRLEKIPLEDVRVSGDLFDTIRARKSQRNFSGRSIPLSDVSVLLKYACGVMDEKEGQYHRAQPSGGGRYPIEVYPIFFTESEGIGSGVYHYNIKAHALDVLWRRPFTSADIATLFTYPWAQKTSFALVLTGVFHRNQMKYGERGYRQILIEAGAIVQNIYLLATARNISCCAIDGVRDAKIEKLLDVDGVTESVITAVLLG